MSYGIYNLRKCVFKIKLNIFTANLKLSAKFCKDVRPFEEIPEFTLNRMHPDFYKPFHEILEKTHKKLGPIVIGKSQTNTVYIADPELNIKMFETDGNYPIHPMTSSWTQYLEDTGRKRGLLFSQGDEWYKNRSPLNTIMLKNNAMKNHFNIISSVCKNLMDIWKINPPCDFIYPLYCWTSECVGAVLFGRNIGFLKTLERNANFQDTGQSYFVKALIDIFETTSQLTSVNTTLAKRLQSQPWVNFNEAANTAFAYGESIILNSIQNCTDRCATNNIRESLVYQALHQHNLDVEIIKNVFLDLILTAVDTTSHTALWALYLLGRNPEIAKKAREEIFSVLKSESTLTLKTIDEIKFIKGIIKETLRLYPSVAYMMRKMTHDRQLCNYSIPAGTWVVSPLILLGRDPNNFTFPLEFRPERWFRKSKNADIFVNHKSKANTPFAHGKRTCIGRKVAELSLSLFLLEALTTFEWTVEKEVDFTLKMVTAPSENIKMKFKLL